MNFIKRILEFKENTRNIKSEIPGNQLLNNFLYNDFIEKESLLNEKFIRVNESTSWHGFFKSDIRGGYDSALRLCNKERIFENIKFK